MATILTWQPPALLTRAEAAKILRVSPRTVTEWARQGKMAAVRVPSGHRRYLESSVRERAGERP